MSRDARNSLCNGSDEEYELMKTKFGAQIVFWPELHQTLIDEIRRENNGKGNKTRPSNSIH